MGVHGINKKKFDGGDELIRKAFKIYSDKDLESSMEDFDFEYSDDKVFEDKIYKVIKKLPIKNPRSKAHIICIAVICMVLVLGCIAGYRYMRSRRQAGQTSVLESVCKEAKTRYDINQSNNNLNAIIGGETSLSDEKTQLKDYYNSRNTAVYVNTKNYDKSGYLYSMYLLNDEEVKKLTDKEVELKKADDTEKLTPFSENAPDDSKYSAGNIYFIGGRKSRKFIVYKNKSDDMYIGKCVGFESLKDHDIIKDKKVNEKKSISAGEFLENIMDIKNADDIREIMFERVRAKSKANPDKRIAVWTSDESKSEFYELLTKESSIEIESVGDTSGQLWFGAAEPQKCYYLAVENNAGEFCVFGIVFEEKDTMVYVEPQYKPETALKLSSENTAKLRKIIKENDKQQ